jgi:xylulokinase
MNKSAAAIPTGSEGLRVLPFGNGAERMLNNKIAGAHLRNIDLNLHNSGHIFRAVQEGIAFSFRYGLDILRENGMQPSIIRAGQSNLFLSETFTQSFVDITGVPVELHESDGSYGAAIGAGIGAGIYASASDAFSYKKPLKVVEPSTVSLEDYYQDWKAILASQLAN